MSQQEIEVILARHLAEYLAVPIFMVDPDGDLLFYNEPAEAILGSRYNETGAMPARELATTFHTMDGEGNPIPLEELPIVIALRQRRPSHRDLWIRGLDGVAREIEVTAFPLVGQANRFLGAIAFFWEIAK